MTVKAKVEKPSVRNLLIFYIIALGYELPALGVISINFFGYISSFYFYLKPPMEGFGFMLSVRNIYLIACYLFLILYALFIISLKKDIKTFRRNKSKLLIMSSMVAILCIQIYYCICLEKIFSNRFLSADVVNGNIYLEVPLMYLCIGIFVSSSFHILAILISPEFRRQDQLTEIQT